MDKDKLLRKVQGLYPTNRSTESLSDEDKKRYRREVGNSPDDRLFYVSAKKDHEKKGTGNKGATRNIKTSQVEFESTQRIIGSRSDEKTIPDKVKAKVSGVRRTLKPSR